MDKKETFTAAIESNEGLIFKIATIYTNSIEDRNDLVQEIIYQLWKSFDTYNQRASLSTWMYRVAMNVAIYHLKASKRKVQTVSLERQVLDFYETNADDLDKRWQMLKEHLNSLSLLEKGIVMLYLEDKSYEEIAEIIGISVSNVGTKLSRIKEKLKTQISKIK